MSNIADPIYLVIMFVVFVAALVISYSVYDALPDFSGTGMKAQGKGFYDALNAMGIFMVVAMILATMGSAYLIKVNPIFFGVSLLLLFVQLLIFPMLVNVFNPIFQNFPAGETEFDLLIWLVQISPAISFVGAALAGIVAMRGE